MAQNKRKLVGVILMLAMLVAALTAFAISASAAVQSETLSIFASTGTLASDSLSISWTSGGVTVKNLKSESTTAIRTSDSDHFRAYANSALSFSVTSGNITKIEVTCTSSSYATALVNSAGSEAAASGSVVTITPSSLSDEYNIAKLTAQVRFKQVVVAYEVSDESCQHSNTTTITDEASCTEAGSTVVTCDDCGDTISTTPIAALGHTGGTPTCNELAVCDTCGEGYGDYGAHNYVSGVCSVCSKEEETELTTEYVMSNYTAGTQYAENEVHILDDVITVTTTQCHFTTELRIYSSTSHDGVAIIKSTRTISKIVLNAGNKVDTLNVYGSTDGSEWTLIQAVSVTSTSYADYAVSVDAGLKYKYLKLDVGGVNQVRVAKFTLTTVSDSAPVCEHQMDAGVVTNPTCTAGGYTTYTCTLCKTYSYNSSETEATGHNYVDTSIQCTVCGYFKPDSVLTIPEATTFASLLNGGTSDNDKYYMTVLVTEVYNTTYGNMNVKDADGNTFVIYGTYDADGSTRYDSMTSAPKAGDTVTVYGVVGSYQGAAQMQYATITEWNHNYTSVVTEPTFDARGYTTYTCACNDSYVDDYVPALVAAAQIGDVKYETLAEAFAAVKTGETITLLADVAIDTETYTIADGVSITLDMNGKKLTVTDNDTDNYELFYIFGEMTVTGEGTINLTSTYNRAWNAMSAIFHNRGGVLTIQNGTFANLGGTDMAWVIDNSGNYYGDATTIIHDGTFHSTYTAIRNRMEQNSHGASGTAILNIYGGTIDGTTSAIWAQAASESTTAPATGVINISGGTIGTVNTARSEGAECMTTVTGGTVAKFKGEVGELTVKGGTVTTVEILSAAGEAVEAAPNADGVYVCVSHTNDKGVVTNPTCTEGGYTTYTCTLCGTTSKGNETAAGHMVVDGDCQGCDFTCDEAFVNFKGAGIRYANATGNESAYYVSLRFGYEFANIDDVVAWGWIYSANGSTRIVTATANDGNVTNLVLTGIPVEFLKADITVQLWYTIEVDGEEVTVYDEVQTRNAHYVLEMIIEHEPGTVAADYAMAVLYAYDSTTYADYANKFQAWIPADENNKTDEE